MPDAFAGREGRSGTGDFGELQGLILEVLFDHQVVDGLAQGFIPSPAENPLRAGIPLRDRPLLSRVMIAFGR